MRQKRRPRVRTIRTDRRSSVGGIVSRARDTGIYVKSPSGGAVVRRSALPIIGMIVVALLAALVIGALTSRDPSTQPQAAQLEHPEPSPEATPTPTFAACEGIELHLPVDPGALTALAFHQASGKKSLHMTSLVPEADMTRAAEMGTAPRANGDGDPGGSSISCLRLWRSNRRGTPDTAADVGADPGTTVLAPVDGTVLEVKPYKLYDKYDDYEIHIQPSGHPTVDVVLIHIEAPSVVAGQRVTGGVTPLAVVRKMSDKIEIQLGGYTTNGGDHVHVQVNVVDVPGVLEQPGGS